MTHTLRRSRSKYGRTRRQRRKQRRMHGGGFFDDIINKFKPSTPEEKCSKAKEAVQEACNNVNRDMEMMPLDSSMEHSAVNNNELGLTEPTVDTTTPPPSSLEQPIGVMDESAVATSEPITPNSMSMNESAGMMQDNVESSMAAPPSPEMMAPGNSDNMETKQPLSSLPSPQASLSQPQTVSFGGAKKSRRKNKNRKQSRRKNMKSRKHKK